MKKHEHFWLVISIALLMFSALFIIYHLNRFSQPASPVNSPVSSAKSEETVSQPEIVEETIASEPVAVALATTTVLDMKPEPAKSEPLPEPDVMPVVKNSEPVTPPVVPAPVDPAVLYYGVFGFTSYYFDTDKTSLYFDDVSTALVFPPKMSWQEVSAPANQEYFSSQSANSFSGPYHDKRCLKIGCLEQDDKDLYYDDRRLNWPKELTGADVAAVSIGNLETTWLVGFTINDNGTYRGEIFYFNGQEFTRIALPETIRSEYFGLFGVGGKDDDFLLVYGSYRGFAYHFHDGQYTDISQFFGIRLMNGGFKPEVVRAEAGKETIWYLYSATSGRTRFAKLWQNSGEEIAGLIVFNNFVSGVEDYAVPKIEKTAKDSVTVLFKTSLNGREKWIEFVDRGFDSGKAKIMQTKPVAQDGTASEIMIKKIDRLSLDLDPASASLVNVYFSTDGKNWQKLSTGNNIPLETKKIRYYYLKVVFSGVKDSFYSPFLNMLYFDYYCQK